MRKKKLLKQFFIILMGIAGINALSAMINKSYGSCIIGKYNVHQCVNWVSGEVCEQSTIGYNCTTTT